MSAPLRQTNILSAECCEELVRFAKAAGFENGETGEGGEAQGRSSSVFWLDDQARFGQVLALIVDTFNKAAFGHFRLPGLSKLELPQISRYQPGDYYAWHTDDGEELGIRERKLSMSIELSAPADYAGGQLEFRNWVVPGEQDIGSALIFLPDLEHQVAAVTGGERYSLVAWAA
jgi:PKHD-type hydroxylase